MILKADLGIESVTAEKNEEDKLPRSLPEEMRSILADTAEVMCLRRLIWTRWSRKVLENVLL